MNRDSNDLRGSSASQAPRRWWIVMIAVMLAFGSTGQTPLVEAAQPAELAVFSMNINNPKTTLACGETVTYLVHVEVADTNGAPTPTPGSMGLPKGMSVVAVKVDAMSNTPAVGDFVGSTAVKTALVLDEDLSGLGAKFRFKANKPGKTTLHFEALVGKEYVPLNLDVKVRPCKYKAATIGEWHVDGPANISIVAVSEDAEVSQDEQGSFTGSARVDWVINSGQVLDCVPQSVTSSSQVDWRGRLGDNDQLTLDGTYESAAMSMPVYCVGSDGGIASGSTAIQLAADPLEVGMALAGGVFSQPQVLEGPEGPMPGVVTIVVIPVDDETAAYIPELREASRGAFSSLLGALLARQ